MSYTSPIYTKIAAQGWVNPSVGRTPGALERSWVDQPYGDKRPRFYEDGGFKPIPKNEWVDRLEAMEDEKATLTDLHEYYKIPVKNQGSTPHCWSYGSCSSFELARARSGLPYINFNPQSVAAPVNNYRASGGWGDSAFDYMSKYGVLSGDQWPGLYYRSDKYEDKSLRAENKLIESYDLIDGNMNSGERWEAYVTALLLGFAGNPAYNHWGHLVCGLQPLAKNGKIDDCLILNSWGKGWGENGKGILYGRKSIPDDCQAARVASNV